MKKICLLLNIVLISLCLISCNQNDDEYWNDNNYNNDYNDNYENVSLPSFDKYLTTTTTSMFTIKVRFKNGGDDRNNMSCNVYWKAYSKKPSKTPSKYDLSTCESMKISNHTNSTTTFEKSHAGYNSGTYIYYYCVCRNSKGNCDSGMTYTIIK